MGKWVIQEIIALLVGLVNLVIAVVSLYKLLQPRPPSRPRPIPKKWKTILIVSLVIMSAAVAALIWQPWNRPVPRIEIANPAEGESVEMDFMVKGTSQNLPGRKKIWMVVFPHPASRYYPQAEPAAMQEGGGWSSRCYFGVEQDAGLKFDLLAVLVDDAAEREFMSYLKDAQARKIWPGLDKLPEGVRVFQRLTVVRKPKGDSRP